MLTCRQINMFRTQRTANVAAIMLMVLGGAMVVVYLYTDFMEQTTIPVPEVVKKKNYSYVYSHPKCEQNKSAANADSFNTFSLQIQDFLYYRHCRHFPMILDLPDKCGGADDVFLLLVIKSPPINYERREVLRKTWAKERLHKGKRISRVFISGTTEGLDRKQMNKLLQLEQQEHSDILQWDFTESFFNLTLKQILFLEWMERNCAHVQFLFNGDDDVLANTDNMVEYLEGLGNSARGQHLFTGHLITNAGPARSSTSKYYIPAAVYEGEVYPPYCGGGGYLLSGYTASVIYQMSYFTPLLPIDDVYMAMCLARAKLTPTSHHGVKTFGLKRMFEQVKNDPCILKELLLIHKFPPAHIYVIWHRLHDPNLKCGANLRHQ